MQTAEERRDIMNQILASENLSNFEKTRATISMFGFALAVNAARRVQKRLDKHGSYINNLIDVNNLRVDMADL